MYTNFKDTQDLQQSFDRCADINASTLNFLPEGFDRRRGRRSTRPCLLSLMLLFLLCVAATISGLNTHLVRTSGKGCGENMSEDLYYHHN
jgi:hypothetical protein